MINKRMEEMVKRGSAIDLSECPKDASDRFYLIDGTTSNGKHVLHCLKNDISKDYCDAKTEQWIWSIGMATRDGPFDTFKKGDVLASTQTTFYQNPFFDCLWLR